MASAEQSRLGGAVTTSPLMATSTIGWTWEGTRVEVGVTTAGSGETLLLLPALSSIGTRHELAQLQALLARQFETVAVDWPGFGDRSRPAVAWSRSAYAAFMKHLATTVVKAPFATLAAGHAAAYALAQAASDPVSTGKLCLLSPTWRGPLPTMTGRRLGLFAGIARAVDIPILGTLIYKTNVNRPVIGMMTRGHVYADPDFLSGARLREKLTVTKAPGARHASIRFVAGELDLVRSAEEFRALVSSVRTPTLILYGEGMPRKSRAEIEALADLPRLRIQKTPRGKLSFYEEFPDEAVGPIVDFLRDRAG